MDQRPLESALSTDDDSTSFLQPEPAYLRQLGKYALPILAGSAAILATPTILSAVGFGAGGVAAKSIAAKLMSASAVAHGGGVPAGGAVAVAQSVGAAGLGVTGSATVGTSVAATTAGVQKLAKAAQSGVREPAETKPEIHPVDNADTKSVSE